MKAIIEIPDDLIRSAGSAIGLSKPHLVDLACLAMERLAEKEELTLNLDDVDNNDKDSVEASLAMMCVTQIMADVVKDYERN